MATPPYPHNPLRPLQAVPYKNTIPYPQSTFPTKTTQT